ncbi:unnamed protein product [Linum tenue]|uniref:Uncharacterized protein n=1 Tax=Linum tenue TaxID=586396 RepID=A0AAV0P035_9ROSI|nr:unnamed protein product [Linum tenue]
MPQGEGSDRLGHSSPAHPGGNTRPHSFCSGGHDPRAPS